MLDEDSTEKSDSAILGSVSFGKYFNMANVNIGDEWRYDVYANFTDYSIEDDYDSLSIGVSLGPNFYSNAQISLPLGINTAWEGKHRTSQSVSFSPSYSRAINNKLRMSSQLSFNYSEDISSNDLENGLSTGLNLNFQYNINQTNMMEFQLATQDNDANDLDYSRYKSDAIGASWNTMLNNIRVSVKPTYTKLYYDEPDPIDGGVERKDNRYTLNLNMYKSIKINSIDITPIFSFTWTKNNSNIDRHDYVRKQVSLQFRYQF